MSEQYTMYWQVDYRGQAGWKRKYYFGEATDVQGRIQRLKYDKIEIKNLSLQEVKVLDEMNPKKAKECKLFQVL